MKKCLLASMVALLLLPMIALAADDVEKWSGEYCNDKGCLVIPTVRQNPMGDYCFPFGFQTADKILAGEGLAGLEDGKAGWCGLVFTMRQNGAIIEVSLDPRTEACEGEAWIKDWVGTYIATE